jgi:two-component system response regulator PilR (NtrC family)
MKARVLVADDEASIREMLRIALSRAGYAPEPAGSVAEAKRRLAAGGIDLVLCDLMMPDGSGLDVLREARATNPELPFIMITAYSSTESAVEAMKLGASDYVPKPFNVDELLLKLGKALEKRDLVDENIHLRKELAERYTFGNILGRSAAMQQVFSLVDRVARTGSTVLVMGESGTGKELIARAIHYNSSRKEGRFVSINCGAMPENLLESELFGHAKGSFTGAIRDKKGLFEEATGGTIFLDEIGETTPLMQVKLLRVLQEKVCRPVGDTREISVDARVIAATNRDIAEMVENGSFREDLYYRINVIQVLLPPLRARREDIPLLASFFLKKYCDSLGRPVLRMTTEAMKVLERFDWPGNVRELENVIERTVALEPGDRITLASLPERLLSGGRPEVEGIALPADGIELEAYLEAVGRKLMLEALDRSNGIQTKAAEMLRMPIRSFRYYMKKYGIPSRSGPERGDGDEGEP